MAIALLDVNVLIALLWPAHESNRKSAKWFGENRSAGWATCPLTESGFVRLSCQPAIVERTVSPASGLLTLSTACKSADHHFWPLETPLVDLLSEIQSRIRGHRQLTDALLLDLAIRRQGRLVTLDARVRQLLPIDSAHQASIVVIGEDAG